MTVVPTIDKELHVLCLVRTDRQKQGHIKYGGDSRRLSGREGLRRGDVRSRACDMVVDWPEY